MGKENEQNNLSPRQQRFVEEYLVDLNATQAAFRAGYSPKTVEQQGSRLLGNVKVAAAIERAKAARSIRTQIKADRVLEELARVGLFDLRKAAKWGPGGVTLKNSTDLDDDTAAGIASVESKPSEFGDSIKIKAHDKISALKLLGDHLGLFDKENRNAEDKHRSIKVDFPEGRTL